ncbi:MAG TPA: pyruvate kinase [Candidatus Acidoferrales bacterium]|nr:pyruvate kinase [Candidatus Acidoferrales bacterium]
MRRRPPPPPSALTLRRAKIVCTIGPATRSPEMADRLLAAGMNVARLNFSHGTHEEHAAAIRALRRASFRQQRPLAILADLQGPKIRTGTLAGGRPVQLEAGKSFVITTENIAGDAARVSTTFARLPRDVHRGDRVLLADGLIELRVTAVRGRDVVTRIVNGGELGEHKGINLPGVKLKVASLTPKDREDLRFALKAGANYVAVSFVRTASDVLSAKALIRRAGYDTPVIAKLEKPEAIENLEEILRASDGVMVARGDLGVELAPEMVPVLQKRIISMACDLRVPVITATQMLESMTEHPRPTRAEASDVANAIFDGSDSVMLSAETASGCYPLETVRMMDRIVREAEANIRSVIRPHPATLSVGETICEAICNAAAVFRMKVIAVFTESGSTARLISKYRPPCPIIAFSPNQETRRRLNLLWGVLPRTIGGVRNIDELSEVAASRLLEERLVARGDVVGIVAGIPFGSRGTTNFMKLHTVG